MARGHATSGLVESGHRAIAFRCIVSLPVPDPSSPSIPRVYWARRVLFVDACLLLIGWLGQVVTAGAAVFVDPVFWRMHLAFVPWVEWLLPLALVLAFVGRMPRAPKVLCVLGLVFLMVQYVTAGLPEGSPWHGAAAIHPLSAFALFWVTIELARRVWPEVRRAAPPRQAPAP